MMKAGESKTSPVIITPSAGEITFPGMAHLGNGVPVYLIDNGTVDLMRVECVLQAGQVMEEVHLSALSASAMLTEGTRSYDAATINDLIDSTGAALYHIADKDTASLMTVTLTRKMEEVMVLAEEVLFSPTFPDHEFRLLTDRRVQAFLTSRQKTSVIAREAFYEALCGADNPYGRIAQEADYRSLTTDDLRRFHKKHYLLSNMYITVAGRYPEQALPLLEKHFGTNGRNGADRPEKPKLHFATAKPVSIFCEVHGSVQSTVRLGWDGITRSHPDYQGLQVATTILGGYFGSRLMRNIREEKGYTYGIHAVAGSFREKGYIVIMTDVANEYREATMNEIKKEISILQETEVTDDEMTLVRNHLMGETARMFDGPFTTAETIRGLIDHEAGHDYFNRFTETVRTITPGKIKELFNTYFNIDNAFEIIAGAR
ncbi:MAG: insulinase family protein [Bacteroidales bacterium]|nr:insulinase family protein [Bacteroidales bacterium]